MRTSPGPTGLRVEHLVAPIGLGDRRPRLSWLLPDGTTRQVASEIEWWRGGESATTGPVPGAESVLVEAPITSGRSRDRVEWRVRVETEQGWSAWSSRSSWEHGLLDPEDWTARWIEPAEEAPGRPGERTTHWLRTTFAAPATIARARLHMTAHGVYEAYLDGVRVGDLELTPGYAQYEHRLQVQTYDVTGLLHPGARNELAAEVSDGWWRGQVGLFRAADQWGETTGLLAQLEVEDASGARTVVGTDGTWRSASSRHVADLIEGETIDLAHPGPQRPWLPVAVPDAGLGPLVASPAPPVRRITELAPVRIARAGAAQVVDFGRNSTGWIRLTRLGAAGSELTLTYGEALDPSGDVTQENIVPDVPMLPFPLSAGQVDRVVVGAAPGAVAEPRHSTKGFRYVRVEGLDHDLATEDVTAVVVHSDLAPRGTFACSDERVNRLHEAATWSFLGNACDVPTDCPTRERAGWSGDWALFLPAAAFLFDVDGFAVKWLRDFIAGQAPDGVLPNTAPEPRAEREGPAGAMRGSAGWGDAIAIAPWEQHLATGDRGVLEEAWPALVRWLDRAMSIARDQRHPERVAARPEAAPHEAYLWDAGFSFGEWLEPVPEVERLGFPAFLAADKSDVATAYLRSSTRIAARIAATLGLTAEAESYAAYSDRVAEAWAAEFQDPDGRVRPTTQATCVRALAFDLVPQATRAAVADQLVELVHAADDHLTTGFLATPLLLPVLADAGHPELAHRLLLQDTWPSWLGMIDAGATTIWERWEGYDAEGRPLHSHNHYSKGAVVTFLHRYVAGIRPVEPGYRRFAIAPIADDRFAWAEATHDSPYGRIRSAWRRTEVGVELDVEVPPGTVCDVTPPGRAMRVVGPGAHRFPTEETP